MMAIITMEYVLKADSTAGNLLSLTEFLFVLFQSLPDRLEKKAWTFRPLLMPWMTHAQHAALWGTMSVLTNFVFAFNITVPIHTLFRSCNIVASVLIGWLFFGSRYGLQQMACLGIITVGIFFGSIGDAKKFMAGGNCPDCGTAVPTSSDSSLDSGFMLWCCGIAILVVVQLVQGTLGHMQATFYDRFQTRGKRSELAEEFMFTSHVISVFPMVFMWESIAKSASVCLTSGTAVFLLLNCFFQLICIKGVYRLSAHYSPLTVNITLSLRKFLSVVVSILWFGNAWTSLHSVATVLVFGGVFAYSQCKRPEEVSTKKEKST